MGCFVLFAWYYHVSVALVNWFGYCSLAWLLVCGFCCFDGLRVYVCKLCF